MRPLTGAAPPPVAAVALVGRGGEPLHFHAFVAGADEALLLQLACFSALDAMDERVPPRSLPGGPAAPAPNGPVSGFLGLLLPVEDYKVFGFATPTGVRILVAVRDVLLREDRVREMFARLHRCYVDAAAAAFAPADAEGAPFALARFRADVARVIGESNEAIRYTGPVPFA